MTPLRPGFLPRPLRHGGGAARTALLGVIVALSLCRPVRGQEWLRGSFIDPDAPRRPAPAGGGTARLGPVAVDLGLADELEYSDNVRLEPEGRAGMSNVARLQFDFHWTASATQDLQFSGSLGERTPLWGPGRGTALWSLGRSTALRFGVNAGPFRITPFFRASRQLDPIVSPVVNQTELFYQTSADGGVQLELPLDHAYVQLLGVAGTHRDHADSTPERRGRRQGGGLRVARQLGGGWAVGADALAYRETWVNGSAAESTGSSAAGFVEHAFSRLLRARVAVGWETLSFRGNRVSGDASAARGVFCEADVEHRIRPNLKYRLALRRARNDGVLTNYYRATSLTLSPTYALGERLLAGGSAAYETADESTVAGDHGHRITAAANLTYLTTGRVNLTLGLEHVHKQSSLAVRRYDVNRVTCGASHTF